MVRCILVETTVPVRIRPLMETWPVNGHFLSAVHRTKLEIGLIFIARIGAEMHKTGYLGGFSIE